MSTARSQGLRLGSLMEVIGHILDEVTPPTKFLKIRAIGKLIDRYSISLFKDERFLRDYSRRQTAPGQTAEGKTLQGKG